MSESAVYGMLWLLAVIDIYGIWMFYADFRYGVPFTEAKFAEFGLGGLVLTAVFGFIYLTGKLTTWVLHSL